MLDAAQSILDADLLKLGADFTALDAARQVETHDGRREEMTDRWWSLAAAIADARPQTDAGSHVQLTTLRRVIEDSYLTGETIADDLTIRLLDSLLPAEPYRAPA